MMDKHYLSLKGWEEVGNSFTPLPPGGYVCTVVGAYLDLAKESKAETLYAEVDIAQGEFKNYFAKTKAQFKSQTWPGFARLSIATVRQDTKLIHFRLKNFLLAVEASNPGMKINPAVDFDIHSLRGKSLGVVFRGKEGKLKKDGKSRWINAVADYPLSVQKILDGEFTVGSVIPFDANNQFTAQKSAGDDAYFVGTDINPDDTPF